MGFVEEERETLRDAVRAFGAGRQLVKCCEEMGELTQAICKLFDKTPWDDFMIESVVEEIADVEIMIEQVRIALAVDPEMERRWRERKIGRLKRRIERERR